MSRGGDSSAGDDGAIFFIGEYYDTTPLYYYEIRDGVLLFNGWKKGALVRCTNMISLTSSIFCVVPFASSQIKAG